MHRLLHSSAVAAATAAPRHALLRSSCSVLTASPSSLLSSACSSSSSSTPAATAATAASVRCFSKRSRDGGLPERRAGGMKLPSEEAFSVEDAGGADAYTDKKGLRKMSKSAAAAEAAKAGLAAGATGKQRRAAEEMLEKDAEGTEEERALAEQIAKEMKEEREKRGEGEERGEGAEEGGEFSLQESDSSQQQERERDAFSAGNLDWRSRTLQRAGIRLPHPSLQQRWARPVSERNTTIIRARAHLNPSDLPPAFEHFNVPALSAEEISARAKQTHASYWKRYSEWRAARPEEYELWLRRLQARKEEMAEARMESSQRIARDAMRADKRAALEKKEQRALRGNNSSRRAFAAAVETDPELKKAVDALGEEEVLKRWNTYHLFLRAEIDSEKAARRQEEREGMRAERKMQLAEADPLAAIADNPSLTVDQRKHIYYTLLKARISTEKEPFWLSADPKKEGEHDWKQADAFVRPGVLPPPNMLRDYSYLTRMNARFSSLHRFLHFERLRQTMYAVKEQKKKIVREKMKGHSDYAALLQGLLSQTTEWKHIKEAYPFLSDILLSAPQHLHLSPWPDREKRDFVAALHKNVVFIASLLDRHFSRRNRNAAWILTYPRSRRPNIDEPLRPMSQREMQAMEAEVLAQQMMQELEADGKVTLPNGEVHQRPEA